MASANTSIFDTALENAGRHDRAVYLQIGNDWYEVESILQGNHMGVGIAFLGGEGKDRLHFSIDELKAVRIRQTIA